MSVRHLPVRPNLEQLRRQAKELLRDARRGDPAAVAELAEHHPGHADPGRAKLADAQHALARSVGAASWPRLVQSCEIIAAICHDDVDAVRRLVVRHPDLLRENAGIRNANWGPPMSFAANLGRDGIVRMLHALGATDHLHALGRATLQSQIDTARLLHRLAGAPALPEGLLEGPAYTLSAPGTALAFELGARVYADDGRRLVPVDVVLETDSRDPAAKHAILEAYAAHGFVFPDTPVMALHRGRLDLLDAHVARDPSVLRRTFAHEEIYPPSLGCHDEVLATQGTPLAGTTLLHLCADYGEVEIARWLLDRGADPNTPAAVDADGFGGHTALFGTVVAQPAYGMNGGWRPREAELTRLLLDHGAEPNARASLRKRLHPGYGDHPLREYRDVTPLSWGERFEEKMFVSGPAMQLIAERGGRA